MTLLEDIEAFYLEHRSCGYLVDDSDRHRILLACSCGVVLDRPINAASAKTEP